MNYFPLHDAAREGNVQAVMRLAKHHDVNLENCDGATPLILAAEFGHEETVTALIDAGSLINGYACGLWDTTALHKAAYAGQNGVVEILMDRGAKVDTQDRRKMTALQHAVLQQKPDVARLLIDHGADINSQDNSGDTPLCGACKVGSVNLAGMLLHRGANVNCANHTAATPLHMTASRGFVELSKLLIGHGANLAAKDRFGSTPIDFAFTSIAHVDDGESSFLSVDLLAKAMQSEEQDRLIFLAFILKPLGLPILVVYTIYLSIVQHQRWMVPLQRAWNILKTIKGDR